LSIWIKYFNCEQNLLFRGVEVVTGILLFAILEVALVIILRVCGELDALSAGLRRPLMPPQTRSRRV
jgi:hypothetical protein